MIATLTSTPKVRVFQPADVEAIVNRDGSQSSTRNILRQATRGPCFTATLDDRPIACGGLMMQWDGVAMAWMILSEAAAWQWIWLSKTTKRTLQVLIRLHRLHRIEAMALESVPANHRWLAWMGFTPKREGIVRCVLADGRSMTLYEWMGD